MNNLTDDQAEVMRSRERGVSFELYQEKREALLAAIDGYFTEIEEAFFVEREKAVEPDIYDEALLDIIRNSCAGELLAKTQDHFHGFIRERAKLKLTFPNLDLRDKSELDKKVERELVKRGYAA